MRSQLEVGIDQIRLSALNANLSLTRPANKPNILDPDLKHITSI